MIENYRVTAIRWILWGLSLQILTQIVGGTIIEAIGNSVATALLSLVLQLVGLGMVIAGLAYYARAKSRHPAWSLLGALSCIGVIVAALLQDRSGTTADPASES